MSNWLETEAESEIKHGDDDSQEITYQGMLLKAGAIEYGDTVQGQEELAAKLAILKIQEEENAKKAALKAQEEERLKTQMVPIICSCGSMKCYAIRWYGLPKPVYQEHIKPLPMMLKDPTAARMKASYG